MIALFIYCLIAVVLGFVWGSWGKPKSLRPGFKTLSMLAAICLVAALALAFVLGAIFGSIPDRLMSSYMSLVFGGSLLASYWRTRKYMRNRAESASSIAITERALGES